MLGTSRFTSSIMACGVRCRFSIKAVSSSGERLQDLVAKIFASPPDLIAKIKQALVPKG